MKIVTVMEMKWFIMVLWMILKNMQFLYSIHFIISNIFHNNYKHYQCFYLFSLVLKKWSNITNVNLGTETVIYEIYKWEESNINIKVWTYYFFNSVLNLLKIDKKSYQNIASITLDISQSKILVIMKIFIV